MIRIGPVWARPHQSAWRRCVKAPILMLHHERLPGSPIGDAGVTERTALTLLGLRLFGRKNLLPLETRFQRNCRFLD
jgi:hypothetical protein